MSTSDAPHPLRVIAVDLDRPLPELAADARYTTAMVVGWRGPTPVGSVDVDLRSSARGLREQIDSLYRLPSPVPGREISDAELPTMSVVVPTVVKRPDDLGRLLQSLAGLEHPPIEIIIVDNRAVVAEPDPLPALLAGHSTVRVVRQPRPGVSAARNAGLAEAAGEIVAFTDDDVRVDPGWLRAIGRRFVREPALQMTTGLILPSELETPAQIWFEQYYGGFSAERTFVAATLTPIGHRHASLHAARVAARDAEGTVLREFAIYGVGAFGAGANMAFRREALIRRGAFDLTLGTGTPARGGEDLEAMIAILWDSGTIGYEPSAVVHHRHRRELPELLHQLRGNGVGFTAMLTALIVGDRRHIAALGWQLPTAVSRLIRQTATRLLRPRGDGQTPGAGPVADRGQQPSRSLALTEIGSYVSGPRAFFTSRRRAAEWAAHDRGAEHADAGAHAARTASP